MSKEPCVHAIAGPEGYLKRGEYFIAWSLATPPHHYGEWSLLAPLEQVTADGVGTTLVWRRALKAHEVAEIESRTTCRFGVKLAGEPWALVRGCRLYEPVAVDLVYRSSGTDDPLRRTGV